MFKYAICVAMLCSCVDPPTTRTGAQSEVECSFTDGCTGGGGGGGTSGMCGDTCRSAADCGGSSLCRVCAGMPGTGQGQCLSGNPFTGAPPDGLVPVDAGLSLAPLP